MDDMGKQSRVSSLIKTPVSFFSRLLPSLQNEKMKKKIMLYCFKNKPYVQIKFKEWLYADL